MRCRWGGTVSVSDSDVCIAPWSVGGRLVWVTRGGLSRCVPERTVAFPGWPAQVGRYVSGWRWRKIFVIIGFGAARNHQWTRDDHGPGFDAIIKVSIHTKRSPFFPRTNLILFSRRDFFSERMKGEMESMFFFFFSFLVYLPEAICSFSLSRGSDVTSRLDRRHTFFLFLFCFIFYFSSMCVWCWSWTWTFCRFFFFFRLCEDSCGMRRKDDETARSRSYQQRGRDHVQYTDPLNLELFHEGANCCGGSTIRWIDGSGCPLRNRLQS